MRDVVLFGPESSSLESPVFFVAAGWFGLLQAYGFQPRLARVAPGKAKAAQMACVRMIRAEYEIETHSAPCGVIPDLSGGLAAAFREEPIVSRGRAWSLSACDTVALIDVPGLYRLTLNDPAALGIAAVYLTAFTAGQLGRASSLYFGE